MSKTHLLVLKADSDAIIETRIAGTSLISMEKTKNLEEVQKPRNCRNLNFEREARRKYRSSCNQVRMKLRAIAKTTGRAEGCTENASIGGGGSG